MSETTEPQEGVPPEEPPPETEAPPEKTEREIGWERRINRLTSRVTSVSRERDELAGRLAALEQRANGQSQGQELSPEIQHMIRAEAQRLAAADREAERTTAFHAAGQKAHEDWPERCQNLMAMGADPQIAQLLVEMPDGARVAGELSDDPEALERIAAIRTERGRAIALGQYAAKLEGKQTRTVSRAPKPPTPVTGRTSPKFDEYNASAQELVERYMKQQMEQRR